MELDVPYGLFRVCPLLSVYCMSGPVWYSLPMSQVRKQAQKDEQHDQDY